MTWLAGAGFRIDYVPPTTPALLAMEKLGYVYKVSFPVGSPPATCGSAADCAVACAAGFDGFVISSDGVDTVTADPNYWETDTVYSYPDNPYEQNGYYHAMADWGGPPGDQFGHFQRAKSVRDRRGNWIGEPCSYYLGDIRFYTRLLYTESRTGAVSWCTPDK